MMINKYVPLSPVNRPAKVNHPPAVPNDAID
jgi:hypothetical protein